MILHLFEVRENVALPTTEALLVSPYKEIWERDTTQDKEQAIKEFTYVELCCSLKKANPFAGYDESERYTRVSENVFPDNPNYVPDELVQRAMVQYKKFQTEASPSMSFYESVVISVKKLQNFLNTVDLRERSKMGMAVYKPTDISKAASDAVNVLNNLTTLKEKVQQELFEASKTKSQRTIGAFEN